MESSLELLNRLICMIFKFCSESFGYFPINFSFHFFDNKKILGHCNAPWVFEIVIKENLYIYKSISGYTVSDHRIATSVEPVRSACLQCQLDVDDIYARHLLSTKLSLCNSTEARVWLIRNNIFAISRRKDGVGLNGLRTLYFDLWPTPRYSVDYSGEEYNTNTGAKLLAYYGQPLAPQLLIETARKGWREGKAVGIQTGRATNR